MSKSQERLNLLTKQHQKMLEILSDEGKVDADMFMEVMKLQYQAEIVKALTDICGELVNLKEVIARK